MSESRFGPELRGECGEWIWEQLQEEGMYLAGELIDMIVDTEREMSIHTKPLDEIAQLLDEEFQKQGVGVSPNKLERTMIKAVLEWEDEFLGLAQIPRAES